MAVCRYIVRFHQVHMPTETTLSYEGPSTIAGTLGAALYIDTEDGKEHYSFYTHRSPLDTSTRIP